MSRIYAIFDDTVSTGEVIQDVIGKKGFADVVVKRQRLEKYYLDIIKQAYPDVIWKVVHSPFEFNEILQQIDMGSLDEGKVLHCFSNFIIVDDNRALLTLKKLNYIEEDYVLLSEKKSTGLMFNSLVSYKKYLKKVCQQSDSVSVLQMGYPAINIDGLVDIGVVGNFIQCITGNFDSRYFNSLQGNEYTLVKSSTNKKKIKAEYTFYHLLPEDMKYWYVMPFNYQEDEKKASYTMQRLHMTDLAIKWVHGSVGENEFSTIMDMYCCFFGGFTTLCG